MTDQITTSLAEAKVLVMRGMRGEDGEPGPEGVSPTVSFAPITVDGRTGNRMTVTDAEHPSGQSINILNGKDGEDGSGTSVTVDDALSDTSENPVQNKVIKEALDGKGTYSKPSGGIPKTDLSQAVQGALDSIAPFEIPVSQSGDAYTTTASAADIIAHVGNLVLVDPSGVRYKETSYLAGGNSAYALFTFGDPSGGNLIAYGGYVVSVESGTVNISLLMKVSAVVPEVSSTDNGKFLRVVSGAWAVATVPSAESNSFGGGS